MDERQPRPAFDRRPASDAEARALASAVRLRILRLCLDEPMTNAQLAARLGRPPASVLHHVRTLAAQGFLEALPAQTGPRGSHPVPYRATRKSWLMEEHRSARAMVEAFAQSLPGPGRGSDDELAVARLGLRLDEEGVAELQHRLDELLDDMASRPAPPRARPWSLFVALHPDADRD